jgi:hypothetical protein
MTWAIAVLVLLLAIVIALLSGSAGRDSSQPGFPFPDGRDSSPQLPGLTLFDPSAPGIDGGLTLTAAYLQNDGTQRANQQAPGESPSSSGLPDRSGSRPNGDGGRAPGVTPQPNRPQAPSESRPNTSPAPSETSPDQPQAPSESRPSLPQTPSTPSTPSAPSAPSVTQPDPPPAPSGTSIPSEPTVSVSVSTEPVQASVTVGDNTVSLP